jgi:hypothetical protein
MSREPILEPEGPLVPSFQQRGESVYAALGAKLGKGTLGQHNFSFSKVEIEGLMGLLSHRFEGVW